MHARRRAQVKYVLDLPDVGIKYVLCKGNVMRRNKAIQDFYTRVRRERSIAC